MNYLENSYLVGDGHLLVGVDEAGRGPLAGPVVAAAVLFNEDLIGLFPEANDSKKLSPRKRVEIVQKIQATGLLYGVGIVGSQRIDEINILNATFEAMKAAVIQLELQLNGECQVVLVDGSQKIKNLEREQIAIIRGDSLVKTISLASIIAKVTRDEIMTEYHRQWPEYGFDRHKGYGTALHIAMIEQHGRKDIHRRTFVLRAGVRKK